MVYEKISLRERYPFLEEATLELYLPENMEEMGWGDKKRPCLLVIPGGGYRFVSRREAEPVVLQMLPEGFNVFVLTYSVDPVRYPAQLRQVAAALEQIWENADAWHCDTDRVAVMGFSAGGHLAANYCNRYDSPEVRQVFPQSKRVNAAVLGYPVITADPAYSHKGSFEKLVGHYPEPGQEQDYYSCNCMVTENTPPTFLWHCTGDKAVPVKNSLLYADALAAKGVPFAMEIYAHGRHGLGVADETSNLEIRPMEVHIRDWLSAMKKWLKLTLN